MTGPLVDPNLAELQAAEPAAFLAQPDFLARADTAELVPDGPNLHSNVARDLAVAVIVVAALVIRSLHRRQPRQLDEASDVVRDAWTEQLPIWVQFAGPAIMQTYALGHVSGTPAELRVLAEEYATDLGNYVGETSGEAMLEGLNRQLNQKWSMDVAWHRAAAGYGLDKQQMNGYLRAAAVEGDLSADIVPAGARTMVDRLLLRRATRIGADQAYTAAQTGRSLLWMKAYAAGQIPDALRQWRMGHTEMHCGICTHLAGQKVAPDQPFLLPNGQGIWAPRAHPGCDCDIVLLGGDGDIIAKRDAPIAAGLALRARDTGRVLMLQRALDGGDPAGGTWEFPGGHIEPGENPLQAAKREWSEEVRRTVPIDARYVSQWASRDGKYVGAILEVPTESGVPTHRRGRVTNPDDPDGDEIEAIAWWDVEHMARNPALRPELRLSLRRFRDAYSESRHAVRKAFGDDPATRDAHGRWASVEGRRSTATLERPDAGLQSLVQTLREIDERNATRKPLTEARGLTSSRSRPLTGGRSLTDSRSLTAGPLTALTQQVATERKQEVRRAAPTMLTVTIRMPAVKPLPGREPDPYYLPYADMEAAAMDYADGNDHTHMLTDWVVGHEVDFASTNQYWRDKAEYGGLDDSFGDDEEMEAHRTGGPEVLRARQGMRSMAAMFDGSGYDFWSSQDHEEMKGVRAAFAGDIASVIPHLDEDEINRIYKIAGYDNREGTQRQRNRLVRAVQTPAAEHGLGDATLDFLTYVRPDLSDTAFGRQLADEVFEETDAEEPPYQQVFVFDQGFHPDDGEDGEGAMVIDHSYEVTDVTYSSSLGDELTDPACAGFRFIHVRPIE